MNSEKVKEIKKALKCCSEGKCEKCLIGRKDIRKCVDILLKDTLTYINELESENEKLRLERDVLIGKKIVEKQKYDNALIVKIDIQKQLKKRIDELESENENLKINLHETENLSFQINQMNGNLVLENQALKDRIAELEKKIENGTLAELGYHIRKSYKNHDDQRYKIILIDEVEIDKIGYDGLTKEKAEARLKELQEEQE